MSPKLDEGPCARRANLAAKLRGETLTVGLEAFGRLHSGKLGEGGIRIGKTDDVVEHLASGRHCGPACDKGNPRSALEHTPLPAVDHPTLHGRRITGGGPVIAREDKERVLPQP